MHEVTLHNLNNNHEELAVTFLPEQGMNLSSYRKGEIEVIDQSTRPLFEERFAGLGALIGPHFHRKPDNEIATGFDESLFPHIARVKANGVKDPFSHGIARYAPWKYVHSETQIQATLSSKDTWNGVLLRDLEGQDFDMSFDVRLLANSLFIRYGITSENPSVLGLHYYYNLPNKNGIVTGDITPEYRDQETWEPIPEKWTDQKPIHLHFDLEQEADYGFHPRPEIHENRMILNTESHKIHILYCTPSPEECSCQVYHPKGASFACIEPISARNPRSPVLNYSILEVKIEII